MGWADSYGVPIVSIYRKGSKLSTSAKVISEDCLEYDDIVSVVESIIRARM